jgi:transcriptional regulator with XRE-family HTH domain
MATTVYGPTLRKERLAASVTVTALADRMGVTRQTVHKLEGMARVPQARAEQYRKALTA